MSVLLDVYIFIAWFGSWSTSSGFGAFLIFFIWSVLLGLAVAASYLGGWLSIVLTILSLGTNLFLAPMIAGVAWLLYFCGLGDWLSSALPSVFPASGYFFGKASPDDIEILIFVVWLFLRVSSLRFMLRICK